MLELIRSIWGVILFWNRVSGFGTYTGKEYLGWDPILEQSIWSVNLYWESIWAGIESIYDLYPIWSMFIAEYPKARKLQCVCSGYK